MARNTRAKFAMSPDSLSHPRRSESMQRSRSSFSSLSLLLTACLIAAGCAASAHNSGFFGSTTPPRENVLHYVSGGEPETLDPQIPNLQNEARICLALFDGLAEYDAKPASPCRHSRNGGKATRIGLKVLFICGATGASRMVIRLWRAISSIRFAAA